jgi:hypothetical protein
VSSPEVVNDCRKDVIAHQLPNLGLGFPSFSICFIDRAIEPLLLEFRRKIDQTISPSEGIESHMPRD